MHVVATAGHVDHGKSTLVLALTGTDPDRFAEEKARGLTIDLGFAWTTLPSGRGIAFVDVPGHVRFLKNMLAGVGGVDACLFVVAATEGWKPQSEEHLRILELVGVRPGVIALTKVGIVDDDRRRAVHDEVADHLAGTALASAEIVGVDVLAGEGVDELRAALDRLLASTPTAADDGRPRLWVDRAFAAKGAGTVVTGTLTGGSIALHDELELLPGRRSVRVRALQSHQEALEVAKPGRRVAVNLAGVTHHDVERGHALVRPGQWEPATVFDCSFTVLAGVDHEVSRRGAWLAYIGAGEHPARVRVLGGETLAPGVTGLIRLRLASPVPLLPGDRFVLRESSRGETVGGGEVLEVAPVRPASRARPDRSVDRMVAERGWVEAGLLGRLTGQARPADVGRWVLAPAARTQAEAELLTAIEAAGPMGLDLAGCTERQRALLPLLDGITVADGRARAAQAADPLVGHPWLAALEADPFQPPPPDGVDYVEVRALVQRGLVVERDGIWFAAAAVDAAARAMAALLAVKPAGVTASDVRKALGTTRKYLLPLLGHLDASGVTRRRGDLRVAGPRLPAAE